MSNPIVKKTLEEMGFRTDDNTTAFLELQLTQMLAKAYDVKYAPPKSMMFLPIDTSVRAGMQHFEYRVWDGVGVADFVADNGADLNRVDVNVQKFTHNLAELGASYGFTLKEMQRAAIVGEPLDARKQKRCQDAVMRKIDRVCAFGEPTLGFKGFLNHPNITIMPAAAAAGGGFTTPWDGVDKTPAEILQDMMNLVNEVFNMNDGNYEADHLLLPPSHFALVNTTPMSSLDNRTILAVFKQNMPGVTVDHWDFLKTADALGTGERAVAYKKDEEVAAIYVSEAYHELAPIVKPRETIIEGLAEIGGCVIKYPLGMVYMDLI